MSSLNNKLKNFNKKIIIKHEFNILETRKNNLLKII